ncbi:hypothetical protein [Micromonospora sp. NPDC047740]|uniref:hypothetical protein n=1 Tax=Micromonospora sp. NPDC047740 TaxID=3364254 RepID=UPI0037200EFF
MTSHRDPAPTRRPEVRPAEEKLDPTGVGPGRVGAAPTGHPVPAPIPEPEPEPPGPGPAPRTAAGRAWSIVRAAA